MGLFFWPAAPRGAHLASPSRRALSGSPGPRGLSGECMRCAETCPRAVHLTIRGAIFGTTLVTGVGEAFNTAIGTADAWSATVLISLIFVFLAEWGTSSSPAGKWMFANWWGFVFALWVLGLFVCDSRDMHWSPRDRARPLLILLVFFTIPFTWVVAEPTGNISGDKTKLRDRNLFILVYVIHLCATAWMLFGVLRPFRYWVQIGRIDLLVLGLGSAQYLAAPLACPVARPAGLGA